MVVAFLRGLLKPKLSFGLRSLVAENVMLEAMDATMDAENYKVSALMQTIRLSVTKYEARTSAVNKASEHFGKAIDLDGYDLYGWKDLIAKKTTSSEKRISLYQLYHVMKQRGILDQLHRQQPSET
jgi:nucleoside-specific outer membrane channel protein Tsx